MKYYLLFISLFFPFIFKNIKADNPPAYLEEGNTWCFYSFHYPQGFGYYRYILDGDTIINNRSYKKMYRYDTDKYIQKEAAYVAGVRQENYKIYSTQGEDIYTSFIDGEVLLYDFSLEGGDFFGTKESEYEENKVAYIDRVIIGDISRKRIYFDPKGTSVSYPYTIWIEGIGSLDRDFFYPLSPTPISSGGVGDWLYMFLENGEIVYGKPDFSFVTEGNHWVERTSQKEDAAGNYRLNRFIMQGDTLINGLTYKKLYKNGFPAGALRENMEHKVFYYRDENTPEVLLYDFHWLISKPLYLTDFGDNEFEVRSSDQPGGVILEMTLEDGQTYQYRDLSENPTPQGQPFLTLNPEVKLICNIGLTAGIFKMAEADYSETSCYTDLLSFYNGKGEVIYRNPAFNEEGELLGIEELKAGKRLHVKNVGNRTVFTLSDVVAGNDARLRIYHIDGKEISVYSLNTGTVILDNLQSGMYLYRLDSTGWKPETGKFFITQ